jgi:hypothetical protein
VRILIVSARSTFCRGAGSVSALLLSLLVLVPTAHLSSPVLGNALQRLEHSLAGQLQSPTPPTDRHEIIISLLTLGTISTGSLPGLSGLFESLLVLVSSARGSSDGLFVSRFKRLGVLHQHQDQHRHSHSTHQLSLQEQRDNRALGRAPDPPACTFPQPSQTPSTAS